MILMVRTKDGIILYASREDFDTKLKINNLGKWFPKIEICGKSLKLGTFATEEQVRKHFSKMQKLTRSKMLKGLTLCEM